MSMLQTSRAQALLREAIVEPETLRRCRRHLNDYLKRYLPLFYRKEQAGSARVVVSGLLSELERKTAEPIARREGLQRKPIQFFVGAGKWDDRAVMAELRNHISQELGDESGVIIFDPSSFPKKGIHSVGVKRQWCGRLGKTENCQVGVFMAYASDKGHAPLDHRLYLPEDWVEDHARREQCHVPEEIVHRKKWQIALDMLERHASHIPHACILADDEFGRVSAFRKRLREHDERYVLDVPSNTLVRDQCARRPRRRKAGRGRKREVPFLPVHEWAAAQGGGWKRLAIRDGAKGPLQVMAVETRVRTKDGRRIGDEERLVAIRSVEANPQTWYVLSNAGAEVSLSEIVRLHAQRHRIEQLFQEGKGEAGLAHYEVRSWVGWHHHMTLSFLALWFLQLEKRRIGGKNTGDHGAAGSPDRFTPARAVSA
jgi:SRSO17 transposase